MVPLQVAYVAVSVCDVAFTVHKLGCVHGSTMADIAHKSWCVHSSRSNGAFRCPIVILIIIIMLCSTSGAFTGSLLRMRSRIDKWRVHRCVSAHRYRSNGAFTCSIVSTCSWCVHWSISDGAFTDQECVLMFQSPPLPFR